jgi:hypothetical protein
MFSQTLWDNKKCLHWFTGFPGKWEHILMHQWVTFFSFRKTIEQVRFLEKNEYNMNLKCITSPTLKGFAINLLTSAYRAPELEVLLNIWHMMSPTVLIPPPSEICRRDPISISREDNIIISSYWILICEKWIRKHFPSNRSICKQCYWVNVMN